MADNRHPNHWSEALSRALKNHNPPWSAENLARELSARGTPFSASSIYQVLAGQTKNPEAATLLAFSDALGLTLDYFLPELAPHRLAATGNTVAIWLIRRMLHLHFRTYHAARALDMDVGQIARIISGGRIDQDIQRKVRAVFSRPDAELRELVLGRELPESRDEADDEEDTEPNAEDLEDTQEPPGTILSTTAPTVITVAMGPPPKKHSTVQPLPSSRQLSTLRQKLGISREALAERVGCDTSTIRNLETGRHYYSPRFGPKIAAALGVEEAEIWPYGATPPTNGVPTERAATGGVPAEETPEPYVDEVVPVIPPPARSGEIEVTLDRQEAAPPRVSPEEAPQASPAADAIWALTEAMTLLMDPSLNKGELAEEDETSHWTSAQLDLVGHITRAMQKASTDARPFILSLPYMPELLDLVRLLNDPEHIDGRHVKALLRGMKLLSTINPAGYQADVRMCIESLLAAVRVALDMITLEGGAP